MKPIFEKHIYCIKYYNSLYVSKKGMNPGKDRYNVFSNLEYYKRLGPKLITKHQP